MGGERKVRERERRVWADRAEKLGCGTHRGVTESGVWSETAGRELLLCLLLLLLLLHPWGTSLVEHHASAQPSSTHDGEGMGQLDRRLHGKPCAHACATTRRRYAATHRLPAKPP
jgi:hypothetical protein